MTELFNLYAFSSESVTNIWAGVGAGLWAVPEKPDDQTRRGKAAKMPIPAFGILYSKREQSLTVPFVILSRPDPNNIEDNSVWHDRWALPFRIKPLGTPRKMLGIERAKAIIPSFKRLQTNNFGYVFRVGGSYAFNRSDATEADWDILIQELTD